MPTRIAPSPLPRVVFSVGQTLAFAAGLWVLMGGAHRLGEALDAGLAAGALGDPRRRAILVGCGLVLLLRARLAVGPLLSRPLRWRSVPGPLALIASYQVGFALLGVSEAAPASAWRDRAALVVFLLGSGLSTGAELARRRCVAASERGSALCTSGPYALVRHPTFLGDLLWGLGWASLTRSPWAALIPLAAAWQGARAARAFERELEEEEGPRFRAWASRTRCLIPFVY